MKRLILGMAMAFAAVTASAEIHELYDAGMQLDYLTLRTRDITLQNRRLSGAAPDIGAWEYRFVRGAMLIFR